MVEKTIGAFEARRQFGRILQEVSAGGGTFLVERHGEPVAAVVPIEVYKQWKRARSQLFETMRKASEQANLSPEEADRIAAEAVARVRAGQ